MKKILLILAVFFYTVSFSQVSKNRLKQPLYSWINRVVPTNAYLDSTFSSFWSPLGNAISSSSDFIGSTTNYPITIKTNNVSRLGIDENGISTTYSTASTGTLNGNGWFNPSTGFNYFNRSNTFLEKVASFRNQTTGIAISLSSSASSISGRIQPLRNNGIAIADSAGNSCLRIDPNNRVVVNAGSTGTHTANFTVIGDMNVALGSGSLSVRGLTTNTNLATIYLNQTTAAGDNYALTSTNNNTTYLNGKLATQINVGGNLVSYYTTYSNRWIGGSYSGLNVGDLYLFNPGKGNNLGSSIEVISYNFKASAKQFSVGTLPVLRKMYVGGDTLSFTSASTNPDAYGLYVEKHVLGANASITHNWGLGVSGDAQITGSVVASNLLSGTYTPTLTNTTNIAASTAYVTGYYRVGNTVTVFGKIDIDVTLAAPTASELQLTLPIASNMTATEDLGGNATSDAVASLVARIKADPTSDQASIVFKAISLSNDSYSFSFSYQIK